jgi:hypothetical protein
MAREFLEVDPRSLRLPPSRRDGAEPTKLQRQIAKFGTETAGMPPLWVHRGKDGELMVFDGVTRATRIAKLLPGEKIPAEVTANYPNQDFTRFPTVEEKLP